ncbi:MAG: 50S ribosomal protein L15e [Thermoplasmata archaeon]|nr:50S ribosomal protein L15e [Thermoplasmata archaeon]
MYGFIREGWKRPDDNVDMKQLIWERMIEWRRENSFVRIDRPTRLDRARELGYKAKPGFAIVRARVRKGGMRKHTIRKGRKPKKKGINKITLRKSTQVIAEERTSKRYPNMEALASYWVGEDGKHQWFEVILIDPMHPVIRKDPKVNWICDPANRGRAFRGLTPAGKRSRGLVRGKGIGHEKVRPSLRAHKRHGN